MVKLARAFSHIQPFKALVIGDFMLDTYTSGKVRRISPEAPVPVMEVLHQESRPGGAGNVVRNLAALGAEVFAVGRIGPDPYGHELKNHLHFVDTDLLLEEPAYQTPVKTRLIADSQQLLRIDHEKIQPLSPALEKIIIQKLEEIIPKVQVLAISDYGKGFLTDTIIQKAITIAKAANVPSIVDPKGIDFIKYRGANIIKPNLSEAYAAAKCEAHTSIETVADALLSLTDKLLITRSESGISLFEKNGQRRDFPVRSKEVKDVTGAGDTVLAMVCLSVANGLEMDVAIQLANIAAGLSIERLGCVQITLSEIAKRLLEVDADSKIFDESHTFALRQVLQNKSYSLLVLEKGQEVTSTLFQTIRNLSSIEGKELIIYAKENNADDEFIHLLSSFREVDYIIIQRESLKNLCNAIHPAEVYSFENEKVVRLNPAIDLLESLFKQSV